MLVEVKFKDKVNLWDLSFIAIDIVFFDDEIEISFYSSENDKKNKVVTSKRIPKKIVDQLNVKI